MGSCLLSIVPTQQADYCHEYLIIADCPNPLVKGIESTYKSDDLAFCGYT